MKTVGIRALRENPGVLTQNAAADDYTLITNRSEPISLCIPFDEHLLNENLHVLLSIKLFDEGILTLVRAAKMAKIGTEEYLGVLGALGVTVVDQTKEELESELKNLE